MCPISFACVFLSERGVEREGPCWPDCGAPTDRPASKRPAEKGGAPFRDDMVPAAQEKRERTEEVPPYMRTSSALFRLALRCGGAGSVAQTHWRCDDMSAEKLRIGTLLCGAPDDRGPDRGRKRIRRGGPSVSPAFVPL